MKKYDDLLVFVTVVDRQSFVGAARQLGLPPGTVSRKVQELEARLGITLLNRTTRRLAVTEVGREVYEAAARGFAAFEEAESVAIDRHERPSGLLRVVAPYTLTHLALMPILPQFRAAYPDVRLEFVITNQAIDLIENKCDLGIRIGGQQDSTYVKRTLYESEYLLVATPDFLQKHGRPKRPGDLGKFPVGGLIWSPQSVSSPMPSTGASTGNWTFIKGDKREDMNFRFVLAATDPIVLLDFARQGQGIAFLPDVLTRKFLSEGELEIVLADWAIAGQLELSVLYRRRATMDSKVRVFIDFLIKHARDI